MTVRPHPAGRRGAASAGRWRSIAGDGHAAAHTVAILGRDLAGLRRARK